jgi:hypothetical protein
MAASFLLALHFIKLYAQTRTKNNFESVASATLSKLFLVRLICNCHKTIGGA